MQIATRPDPNARVSVQGVTFTHADIFRVVDRFYRLVAVDEVLRVPFATVQDWSHHIEKLTHFWWFNFGGKIYLDESYDPVRKHFQAGYNVSFLQRWLQLFHSVLADSLLPEQRDVWTEISARMGQGLLAKNEMYGEYLKSRQARG